jgi:DNA-directed RNA polymerase specialized sigma24 family protein
VALTGGALPSPKPLKFEKKSRDHEAIFLNHYDWLLDWAHQHTRGASEEAEDLVQDLYVRFVQMKSGPDFTDDDQIRAYLYTSLKNLFISKKLRSGRDAVSGLLAVDFDSVEFAISAVDRSQLLHVRSDLAGICEYACIRRKTNRAASALILRFFLGYLSTEVMALLKARRSNVDTLIETARLEGKAYLNRPGVLRFLSRGERKSPTFPRYLPEQPEALFTELQRRIFSETESTCLPPEELQDRYLRPDAPAFSTQEVAHLASCRVCLNQASRLLGLPHLTLRFFTEGDPPEIANPPSARTGEDGLKKLRRKLRETYEHRPKKLQIVVDGEVRGVQTITSASSSFQIALSPLSQPGFVEVLSEQGVALLYFDLRQDTLDVPAPRVAAVDLSDDRQLSVSLTLAGGAPVIDVSYYDPLLEVGADGPPSAQAPIFDPSETGSGATQQVGVEAPLKGDSWLSGLLSKLKRRRPWAIAIAVGVCVLIGLGFAYTRSPGTTKKQATGTTILDQSIERALGAAPPHGAVRETFSLEVHSAEGKTIATAEVESLRSADRPLQTLRLRTTSGNVLASHWIDASGKARDVSNTAKSKPEGTVHTISVQDKLWQHPPNTADFEQLAGDNEDLALREVQDGYEVSFKRPTTMKKASIVEGRLVIANATMRPVAETLRVQDADGTREYRFQELRYEVLRAEQVRASDFIPDSYVYNLSNGANTGEAVHLALQALQVLSNQPQNIQAAVDITRNPNNAVEITGVLSTRQEARSLIQSLRALQNGADLRIDLHTSDEPLTPRHISTVELSPPVSIAADRIPLDSMLRESLSPRLGFSGADVDERVQEAAREIVARSARVHRAAWDVSQIGSRDFRSGELAAMGALDRQLWLTLLARPLAICDLELTAIGGTLIGERTVTPIPLEHIDPISTVSELVTTADSLRENADRLDRLVAAGFALSPEASSAPVSQAELLNQLSEVQREERRLALTVQRLQQAAPQYRNE